MPTTEKKRKMLQNAAKNPKQTKLSFAKKNNNEEESAIKECDKTKFPNLFVLLKIGSTLPISLCECERSFSVLRRLRTRLRSSMTTSRLSSLALMNIHYNHHVDYERVVKTFLNLHPRMIDVRNLIFN